MGHTGFVFCFLCVWHAVKWAVQIFAPLCVDQMDSSVLECLASHKKQIDGDNVIACQEKKKCVKYYIYHKMNTGKLNNGPL